VHVDQQQCRVEDEDEGQHDGAQRVQRALDAGLDRISPEIAAAAKVARPTGGVMSPMIP